MMPSRAGLEQRLMGIDVEARALQASGFRPALASVPSAHGILGALAAGVMLAGLLGFQSVRTWTERDHVRLAWLPEHFRASSSHPAAVASAKTKEPVIIAAGEIPGLTEEVAQKLAKGEYEVVNDGFGRRVRGPLAKWENFAPSRVVPLPVVAKRVSTPTQQAYAKVSAELLLQPYARNSVNAFIAVRVPMDGSVGLMVFNGRERRLADNQAFALHDEPADHTWYQIDQRRVIYLGVPAELRREKTLASE
jgi:hypothetical protein